MVLKLLENFLYSQKLFIKMIFTTVLVSLLAFIGILLGALLAFFTKEELEPGQKYFEMLIKGILLVLMVVLLFKSLENYLLTAIAFFLGIVISFLFRKNYFYFGIALFSSSFYSKDFFTFVAALIFLYGLPFGTLIAFNNLKKIKRIYLIIFTNFILFVLPAIILFFGPSIISYKYLFLAFSSGALLAGLLK